MQLNPIQCNTVYLTNICIPPIQDIYSEAMQCNSAMLYNVILCNVIIFGVMSSQYPDDGRSLDAGI